MWTSICRNVNVNSWVLGNSASSRKRRNKNTKKASYKPTCVFNKWFTILFSGLRTNGCVWGKTVRLIFNTLKSFICEGIYFDTEFFDNVVQKCDRFFEKYISVDYMFIFTSLSVNKYLHFSELLFIINANLTDWVLLSKTVWEDFEVYGHIKLIWRLSSKLKPSAPVF